jgi:cold shock CspA family protein
VSSQKTWQNTQVFVERGDTITINAHGSWSPWPEVSLWSGPDGNDLWAAEVPGISGAALMGRLGYQGKPFQIGSSKTFQARDYGMLYLAMNDPFKYLYNNQGDLSVDIYLDVNRKMASSAGSKTPPAYRITGYNYDDQTGKGFIAAETGKDNFVVRKWLLNKIGEIASSKNVALDARRNRAEGGAYRVTDENIANGVLSIEFETIW